MGSQQVTNFSLARKKRIQTAIRDYDPASSDASRQALEAGIAAAGSFTKSSSFTQALTSPSVEMAYRQFIDLKERLSRARSAAKQNEILAEFGVKPGQKKAVAKLAAGLTKALREDLTASQKKTASASAAEDAFTRSLLDVASKTDLAGREPAKATPEDLARAIRHVRPRQLEQLFYENTTSSLANATLDAGRGRIQPRKVASVKEAVHREFARKLARRVLRTAPGTPHDVKEAPARVRENLPRTPNDPEDW